MNTNVLCLGAGEIGAAAAKIIADFPQVTSLTVADLNLQNAQAVAKSCNAKTSACSVDVSDRNGLIKLMQNHDVVLNCVGPFFRFALPTLQAAITAGVHYFDICDDPEPTLEMLKLNQNAKDSGITAIVGLGATPGITNVLAAKVFSVLSHTEELHAAWSIEDDDPENNVLIYSAALVHWMQQCSGTILECRDSKIQLLKPLQKVKVRYPRLGTRTLYTVGHPEPVAFKHSYPDIKHSSCYMVMPSHAAYLFQKLSDKINNNVLTLEEAAHTLVEYSQKGSFFQDIIIKLLNMFDGPQLPKLFVIGKGQIGERKATAIASLKAFPDSVAQMTAAPLAIGVQQFLEDKITLRGVLPPELAIPADDFLLRIAPYCTSPAIGQGENLLTLDIDYE